MWTTRRVQSFLAMLTVAVHRMDDASGLKDALEASIFFATSMGRLGGDFTSLLPEIFEPRMVALVIAPWKDGVTALQDTLKVCRDAGVATPLTSTSTPQQSMAVSLDQPPRLLLTVPPLARLVNAFLEGLNDWRRCLLPGVFGKLRTALDQTLADLKTVLDTNHRAVMAPGLRGEAAQLREAATTMRELYTSLVEPYLRGALEVALGDLDTAKEYLQQTVVVEEEEEEETEEEEEEQEEDEDEENDDDKVAEDTEDDAEQIDGPATEEADSPALTELDTKAD